MVIRPNLHAAKAAEIAFSVVRAFVLERNRVIDALRVPSGMKRVPTAALVGIERGKVLDVMAHVGSGVTLVGDDERKRLHEGFVTTKEAKRLSEGSGNWEGDAAIAKPVRPEVSGPLNTYIDLHRHAAARLISRRQIDVPVLTTGAVSFVRAGRRRKRHRPGLVELLKIWGGANSPPPTAPTKKHRRCLAPGHRRMGRGSQTARLRQQVCPSYLVVPDCIAGICSGIQDAPVCDSVAPIS